jgi:hypothetical protein
MPSQYYRRRKGKRTRSRPERKIPHRLLPFARGGRALHDEPFRIVQDGMALSQKSPLTLVPTSSLVAQ